MLSAQAEIERRQPLGPPCSGLMATEGLDAEGTPVLVGAIGVSHSSSNARVLFGDVLTQRQLQRTETNKPANSDAEVQQLPLF